MDQTAEQRARLAEVEAELARLQAQYELAMSAFKFDEANALQRQIAPLDAERRVLAQALPPPVAVSEPPADVVPVMGRPRRGRPTRRRR